LEFYKIVSYVESAMNIRTIERSHDTH